MVGYLNLFDDVLAIGVALAASVALSLLTYVITRGRGVYEVPTLTLGTRRVRGWCLGAGACIVFRAAFEVYRMTDLILLTTCLLGRQMIAYSFLHRVMGILLMSRCTGIVGGSVATVIGF